MIAPPVGHPFQDLNIHFHPGHEDSQYLPYSAEGALKFIDDAAEKFSEIGRVTIDTCQKRRDRSQATMIELSEVDKQQLTERWSTNGIEVIWIDEH